MENLTEVNTKENNRKLAQTEEAGRASILGWWRKFIGKDTSSANLPIVDPAKYPPTYPPTSSIKAATVLGTLEENKFKPNRFLNFLKWADSFFTQPTKKSEHDKLISGIAIFLFILSVVALLLTAPYLAVSTAFIYGGLSLTYVFWIKFGIFGFGFLAQQFAIALFSTKVLGKSILQTIGAMILAAIATLYASFLLLPVESLGAIPKLLDAFYWRIIATIGVGGSIAAWFLGGPRNQVPASLLYGSDDEAKHYGRSTYDPLPTPTPGPSASTENNNNQTYSPKGALASIMEHPSSPVEVIVQFTYFNGQEWVQCNLGLKPEHLGEELVQVGNSKENVATPCTQLNIAFERKNLPEPKDLPALQNYETPPNLVLCYNGAVTAYQFSLTEQYPDLIVFGHKIFSFSKPLPPIPTKGKVEVDDHEELTGTTSPILQPS